MVEKDEVVVLENVSGVDEDTHMLSGNPQICITSFVN
jgi:hypothetical protein